MPLGMTLPFFTSMIAGMENMDFKCAFLHVLARPSFPH